MDDKEKEKAVPEDGIAEQGESAEKDTKTERADKDSRIGDAEKPAGGSGKKKGHGVRKAVLAVCLVLCIAALAALAISIFAPDLFDSIFHKDPVSAWRR